MVHAKDLHLLSLSELSEAIRSRNVTAATVMDHFLSRIEKYDGAINSFVHINEKAKALAKGVDARIDAGEDVGVLAGIPFGVKDFTHVKGMPTYEGSKVWLGSGVQASDDPVIERLLGAGAIPTGKTNVPEFGVHSATYNETFGVTRNPWSLSRTPGGSSGGSSAAVAAGLVPFATGTDGGGSIRTPAAFCGLVGLKPTHGLIPGRNGQSLLSCLGFLTRSVEDTALLLDVTCGAHVKDRLSIPKPSVSFMVAMTSSDLGGASVAWSEDFGYAPMDPEVVQIAKTAYGKLLESTGLSVSHYQFHPNNAYREWIFESLNFLEDELQGEGIDTGLFDQRTQQLLHDFSTSCADEHISMKQAFAALEMHVAELFSEVDFLCTPATSVPAFGAEDEIPARVNGKDATWTGAEPLSMFANIAGIPAVSVPAGITSNGLPVGLQIAAPRHKDAELLKLASILEKVSPWSLLAPKYD